MPPVVNNVVKPCFYKVQNKQYSRPNKHSAEQTVGNVIVNDVLGNRGIQQVAKGNQKSATHIDKKQFFVRLIKLGKLLYELPEGNGNRRFF
jgi:hypothetical protein